MVDADPEVPLFRPAARHIQPRLIVRGGLKPRRKFRPQGLQPRPGTPEAAADDPVQNRRIARQIARKARSRPRDINDQFHKRRVRFKQRKDLHPRRQARQKAVQRHKRLVGVCCARQLAQKPRAQPPEDAPRPVRPQRRIAFPALGNLPRRL